ncbi:hypothetical protein ACWDRB_43100 [Nonomuraea sp. NPDC003707]
MTLSCPPASNARPPARPTSARAGRGVGERGFRQRARPQSRRQGGRARVGRDAGGALGAGRHGYAIAHHTDRPRAVPGQRHRVGVDAAPQPAVADPRPAAGRDLQM